MQKSTIKQMLFNERGHMDSIKNTKKYFTLLTESCKKDKEFRAKAEGQTELLELYNQAVDSLERLSCEETDNYFAEGFRFGVLLAFDIIYPQDIENSPTNNGLPGDVCQKVF